MNRFVLLKDGIYDTEEHLIEPVKLELNTIVYLLNLYDELLQLLKSKDTN